MTEEWRKPENEVHFREGCIREPCFREPCFRVPCGTEEEEAMPWWLSGGIPAANCIAAYQPKGAASLAASYTNLANPGTYNAAPGVAPAWAAATGWTGDGLLTYLRTGIVPVNNQTWSMFVQYSGASVAAFDCLGAIWVPPRGFGLYACDWVPGSAVYQNGDLIQVAPALAAGNLGVAGTQGYRNGVADGGAIAASAGALIELYLLAQNNGGGPSWFTTATVPCVSIYDITLTQPQITALVAAMALL